MQREPKLFDVIAMLEDLSARGLVRGQVGTIVEKLDGDFLEVEFSDNSGRTYATLPLRAIQFLVLHHDLATVA